MLKFLLSLFIVSAAYSPVPTGSPNGCILDFQSPQTAQACADCIMTNRPDIRTLYNSAGQNACNNSQISNHWCNGGLGLSAIADCNGVKNGICSQPPGSPCLNPTIFGRPPTRTPTPPATINTIDNPRGCGILFTSGSPSCWCNNGGGQGLCGRLRLDGPGGCRELCERGVFVGPKGYTLCYMMPNNSECRSNDNGSYRYCEKKCSPSNPGFSQTVGCEYPNKTVFGIAKLDASCVLTLNQSSNFSFFKMIDSFIKGIVQLVDISRFSRSVIRVPGLQKAECNPVKEICNYEK